jgi:hypothetical protein
MKVETDIEIGLRTGFMQVETVSYRNPAPTYVQSQFVAIGRGYGNPLVSVTCRNVVMLVTVRVCRVQRHIVHPGCHIGTVAFVEQIVDEIVGIDREIPDLHEILLCCWTLLAFVLLRL